MDKAARNRIRRVGLMAFSALLMAYFFVYFHRMTGGAISETLESYYGVNAGAIGILSSAYLYAYTLMQIPSGIITDRFGPRKAATFFIAILGIGSLVCAVSAFDGVRSFGMLVVGRALIGIGAAVISIPNMKIAVNWFRKDRFSTLTGISLMVGNLGAVFAAYPLVYAIDSIGLAETYVALTILTAGITLAVWLLVRDRPSDIGLPDIYGEDEPGVRFSAKESLKKVFSAGRGFWPAAVWIALFYAAFTLWSGTYAGLYYSEFGLSSSDYSVPLTFVGIGMIFGAPIVGFVTDRFGLANRTVIAVMTALICVLWLAICMSDEDAVTDMPLQCGVNFAMGFLTSAFALVYGQVKDHFPREMSGVATGSINFFPFMGGAVAASLAGVLITDGSAEIYAAVWWWCLALCFVSLISALFMSVPKKVTQETL